MCEKKSLVHAQTVVSEQYTEILPGDLGMGGTGRELGPPTPVSFPIPCPLGKAFYLRLANLTDIILSNYFLLALRWCSVTKKREQNPLVRHMIFNLWFNVY